MKKVFFLVLLISSIANAQIVNIPNPYFKSRLISNGVDTNNDGEIQNSEALVVQSLTFYGAGYLLTDLTGIEAFVNLTSLNCNYTDIASLNISTLTNLINLDCSFTNLTSLDISNLPNLTVVNCQGNQFLTNLNASGDDGLETLNCEGNVISTLNVTGDTNLSVLSCAGNALTSIDLSSLTSLTKLYCRENQLASLDVSSSPLLTVLFCEWNQLTSLVYSPSHAITNLDYSGNSLSNLDVSVFTNLKLLNCSNNNITTLNVLPLTNLTMLECNNNNVSTLDVSTLTNLVRLSVNWAGLTALDVTPLVNLTYLDCGRNFQISSLDVTPLTHLSTHNFDETAITYMDFSTVHNSLTNLGFGNNSFPPIDLNQFSNLQYLAISHASPWTTMDVSSLIHLKSLYLSTSNLTTLDLSGCHSLIKVIINSNPNLVYLNLKTGIPYVGSSVYDISNNPNLIFICCNDNDVTAITNASYYNTALVINSYCSFNPGGNYNVIKGKINYDLDNNGCDSNDLIESNIRVNLTDGITQGASFTNNEGNYTFYTQAGSFDLTPAIENPSWFTFSPATATIAFADNNNNTATQDFCITANGVHPDLEVILAPITQARPGFDAIYKLVYRNKGNVSLSNWTGLSLNYDSTKMTFLTASQITTNSAAGFLEFGYTVNPFESGSIEITFHINTPTDASPVNIGDHLGFTATVTPVVADENPADNTFSYSQTVVGSFDPNDITCIEGNVVPTSEIGEYLHYVINFENTGTADAQNIVVSDIINQEQFDLSSLQVVNSSNPVTAKLTGNIAEFIFQNISLHSGGHGNILIKIKSKGSLAQGDNVSKQANIYFDYNAPVATNIENTIFQTLSNPSFPQDATISLYPNPTQHTVNIKANNTITSVQLFDVQGRLLQTKLVNENNIILDITTQSAGVYFIKVTTDKGIKVEKIVKE
jgi:hypothetical protein